MRGGGISGGCEAALGPLEAYRPSVGVPIPFPRGSELFEAAVVPWGDAAKTPWGH